MLITIIMMIKIIIIIVIIIIHSVLDVPPSDISALFPSANFPAIRIFAK